MFDTSHLHPMIVHFPVALIIIGFLADLGGLFFKKEPCLTKTGFYLMILGTLAALAAVLTGEFFTGADSLQGEVAQVEGNHEIFAKVTLALMILASLFRIYIVWKKKEGSSLKWVAFGMYFLAMITVSITGFLGGTMVYNFMIGI